MSKIQNLKFKIQSSDFLSYFFPFILLIVFVSFTLSSCDKEERLYGSWRLQTVFMNGDTLNDSLQFNVLPRYTFYTFSFSNNLLVQTYALGIPVSSPDGFYKFENNSTIEMNYTLLYKQYNIKAKIKKLTKRELDLEYDDNGNHYSLVLYAYSY